MTVSRRTFLPAAAGLVAGPATAGGGTLRLSRATLVRVRRAAR